MKLLEKIRNNFHSFKDIWLFISIFNWATLLPLIIKFLPLPRTMQMITPSPNQRHGQIKNMKSVQEKIVRYTDYILNLRFWIYRPTCLKRSLLLYHFLSKIGMHVQICFGVKFSDNSISKNGKNLDGHAWLLLDGEIFLEKDVEMIGGYQITYRFPVGRPQAEHQPC